MFVAIDDTYGPDRDTGSIYVTGKRRTHVAVSFPDSQVCEIRKELWGCLTLANEWLGEKKVNEFHFVDVYNRKFPWNNLPAKANLAIFSAFTEIYTHYRWQVFVQTIDDRTLSDDVIAYLRDKKVEGLSLNRREDISFFFLLLKVKKQYISSREPIHLVVDEGRMRPGRPFGSKIFHDYPAAFDGKIESSANEPLLQIADFFAFCINRSTYLSTKKGRTDIDMAFLKMVAKMQINSADIKTSVMADDFSVEEFDDLHRFDMIDKKIKF
jgi:hypothetical protein